MRDALWTPYAIEIILHHYCSSAPFSRKIDPGYGAYVQNLRDEGILEYDDEKVLRTTPKGSALVEAWRATPAPIQKWVDPRFDGLKD